MLLKKILPLFCFLIPCMLHAQNVVPAKTWDKTFGGGSMEEFKAMDQTSDGGYIIGGWSPSGQNGDKSSPTRGGYDFWVVKINANGIKQWDQTFGGTADDELNSLQQTADGGYILAGSSSSGISIDKSQPSQGLADFWIVKLNASGTKLWDKTYGGSSNDKLYAIRQTPDGGYILGGTSGSGVSGDKSEPLKGYLDFWVIKLDSAGNKIWDKTLGGDGTDHLFNLNLTSDGGYILTGDSYSGQNGDKSQPSYGAYDLWVVKLNANGIKQWDKAYGGNSQETGYEIVQTSDGGYIVTGNTTSLISGNKTQPLKGQIDAWVLKLDSSGNKTWEKSFGGPLRNYANSVKQTQDGGYLIAGFSESGIGGDKSEPNLGKFDGWLIKTDSAGNKQWDKTYGGTLEDYFISLQHTADGGFVIGSTSRSGQGYDKSENSRGGNDYWILKFAASNLTGIPELKNGGYSLSQNVPNPFIQNTTFSFNLPKSETVEFTIFNSQGKTVAKLQKKYPSGENSIKWQELPGTEGLAPGFYFYHFSVKNYSEVKKMIFLK